MLLDDAVAGDELTLRLNLPINFVRLRQCGICITNEPFLRRILVSVYRYNINNHLSKVRFSSSCNWVTIEPTEKYANMNSYENTRDETLGSV